MSEIPKEKIKRNSLLNQKIKKNLNNIIKEIENIGKLGDLQVEDYIKAMKIPPIDRKIKDLAYIKKFLEKSALAQKFKGDNFNEESLDQILTSCAAQLKYFHLEKDKVLFKIGEEPDNFYLILNGKIGILKPFSYYSEMTGLEYFYHIEQLKKNNEMYILKQTLEKNYTVFKYDYNDINIVSTVVMKILIEDYFSFGINHYNSRTIEEILKICGFKENYFNVLFDSCLKDDKEYVSKMERIILKKIPKVKKRLIEKYRHLSSESGKFRVTLFEYKTILELGNNFFFGDTALDKTTTRNATIKTVVDTDLCYLELDYYKSYLRNEKQRLTMKEVTFLINNFCFVNLTPHYFEKKFLNHFLYEEKYENEFIIKEGQEAKFVYFMKEGFCDVYVNKNVFEIHNLISYLSQLETDPKFNVNNILLECQNDFHSLKDKLSQIVKTKIFCVNNIDILGLESIFFGLNYLYNVKATSKLVKYYKLELKFLLLIMQEEPTCYYICKSDCIKKMNILIQRLTNLNQTKINMIDSNETVNMRKLQSELDLNKEEKKLEFGEIDFEKNQIKMMNEFKKKFNLEREN
jgi:CRP-like cAMP-binding protein